jgi:flagellar hook-associated protein 3 FlgL
VRIIFDVIRDGLSSINTASTELATAQRQLSTGKRVAGAGDDPLAVQQAIGERTTLGTIDAYRRTSDTVSSQLAAADAVLMGLSDKLTAASVAALSAKGDHATAEVRTAASERVRSLRDAVAADINTSFRGTYLFAGTNVTQPPYVQSGSTWTYQGNSAVTQIEVDRGRTVAITIDGRQIMQGGDATDVLTALDSLAAAIDANDIDGINAGTEAVERAFTRTQRALATIGAGEQAIDEASVRLALLRTSTEARRAKLEDANMAEAATRLAQADTAYRAALGAVSTAERQSLLDYLR